MSATREKVLKSAMELSETDRLILAAELMETVSDDFPEWSFDDSEIPAAVEFRASDRSPAIPWETVQTDPRTEINS